MTRDSIRISAIAAIGKNRELGKDNKLLWHIPEDFKRFKTLTSGHPIIMGRKTFESIGRILPNRTNIIITRDQNYAVDGAVVVHSLDEAIEKSITYYVSSSMYQEKENIHNTKYVIHDTDEHEVFIIGGGQIFTKALEKGIVDRLYLTVVHKTFEADAFFPDYSQFTKVLENEDFTSSPYAYSFITLTK